MNSSRSRLTLLACAAVLTLTVTACGDDEPDAAPPATEASGGGEATGPTTTLGPYQEPLGDIVGEAITQYGAFNALAGFLVEAGLVGALREPNGPFTVFAPPNEAFEALPPETLDAVYDDKELLTAVLTYHVVAGEYTSDMLTDGMELETLQGGTLTVTVDGDQILINDIPVVAADVPALNGVIHVISGVLVPG